MLLFFLISSGEYLNSIQCCADQVYFSMAPVHTWVDMSFSMIMHQDTRHVSLLNASRNIPASFLCFSGLHCPQISTPKWPACSKTAVQYPATFHNILKSNIKHTFLCQFHTYLYAWLWHTCNQEPCFIFVRFVVIKIDQNHVINNLLLD